MAIDVKDVLNDLLYGGGRYQCINPSHPTVRSYERKAQNNIYEARGDVETIKKHYAIMRSMKGSLGNVVLPQKELMIVAYDAAIELYHDELVRLGVSERWFSSDYSSWSCVKVGIFLRAVIEGADYSEIQRLCREVVQSEQNDAVLEAVLANALNAGVYSNDADVVRSLIKAGALTQVARRCRNQAELVTLLLLAVSLQNQEMVRLLLSSGAINVDSTGLDGFSPLYGACTQSGDCVDIARMLIGAGARANEVTREGFQIIYVAAQNGNSRCVELLARNGADVNFRTPRGNTPLGNAADEGQLATVKKLLELGANPNSRNNDGLSAADMARNNGHYSVASFIENWRG